jgi:acetyl esterase/lipase
VTIKPVDTTKSTDSANPNSKPTIPPLYRANPVGSDPTIHPIPIAAVWTLPINTPVPHPTTYRHTPGQRVIIHFHGGAYVLFSPRDEHMGFGAQLLTSATPGTNLVLSPQYRIACYPASHFPAALQDAVTTYAHVLFRLGVPAEDVVLSGDSAGGNLALALLRFACESGGALPEPGGVLLFSPWVDLSITVEDMARRPARRMDVLPMELLEWAYRAFLPERVGGEEGVPVAESAYISPLKAAVPTRSPIWVTWGDSELLKGDILRWVEVQKAGPGRFGTYEVPDCPHDITYAGKLMGMEKQARKMVEEAMRFLDAERE